MSSPLEILDQQEAERAKELKKLAQNPCYDHTQCGEDCLSDCPHYAERNPDEKAKPAYKYGLEISEPQKRLWVGEVINGSVYKCLYSDTWGGIRMIGTREKTIENAKLIVKALNAFDSSVDAPYCHDLEQRIELLEMQLEEAQAKAAACDKLVLALGEHPSMSAEAGSRAYLDLPEPQMRLLRKASALGEPVAVVVFSGRPLVLTEADGLALYPIAALPLTAVCLNDGRPLKTSLDHIPTLYQKPERSYLHISGIPADEHGGEPLVIRLTFAEGKLT